MIMYSLVGDIFSSLFKEILLEVFESIRKF